MLASHDLEAAVNLGATPFKAFLQITLPLSLPGMIAGSMLVFIPAVGEFAIPRLLGGNNTLMIGGFSTRWYGVLLADHRMLEEAWLSLRIATVSATIAAILGTLAGLVLARFGQFRGRTILSGMVSAPLVMSLP